MSYDRETLHRQLAELLTPEFSGDITLRCLNGQVQSISVSATLRATTRVVWTWHQEREE